MNAALKVLLVAAGYLAGSIPFGVVLTRAFTGKDVRSVGSGNIGASNVTRAAGKAAGVLTLVLDAAKASLPMIAARGLLAGEGAASADAWATVVGAAAFLGHIYPVWLRFKGGKGVATAAGVLLAINPILGIATLATWLIVAFFTRYSSLAALCAAIFAPLFDGFLFGANVIAVAIVAMSALLIWRHRANIAKLVAGQESRIGDKKKAEAAARTASNKH
jgi:glycerol-3-phosphate acyltransferase PlsY